MKSTERHLSLSLLFSLSLSLFLLPGAATNNTATACAAHQWFDQTKGSCENCPDGQGPSDDKTTCEDERVGGLNNLQITAIGVASTVVCACATLAATVLFSASQGPPEPVRPLLAPDPIRSHTFTNGTYKGEMKGNAKDGEGKMRYSNGEVYDGEWLKDMRHGRGKWSDTDGETYDGCWNEDKRNGQGTASYANGESYTGQWSNDEWHGNGTRTWALGAKYTGQYKDSTRHGDGTYTYENGDKYTGQFNKNDLHGDGTFTWADGDRYVGTWENDKIHGRGTSFDTSGTATVQDWVHGENVTPTSWW